MNTKLDKWVATVLGKAQKEAADLKPWPGYFESRAREFSAIFDFLKIDNAGSALEIGCGNGFTSALLSGVAKEVVAFDLPLKTPDTHSIGIDMAGELLKKMDVKNADVIGGRVQALPFQDESFDLILSEYVLQYVPDKPKAIAEMRRVLKKDGIIITLLPNFTARLYAPVIQYKYITNRAIDFLCKKVNPRSCDAEESPFIRDECKKEYKKKRTVWDHILLRPDGAYRSFREELFSHMPWAWKAMFKRESLKVVSVFSTEIFPLVFFSFLGSSAGRFIPGRFFGINKFLGRLPVINECGYSICIIAKK